MYSFNVISFLPQFHTEFEVNSRLQLSGIPHETSYKLRVTYKLREINKIETGAGFLSVTVYATLVSENNSLQIILIILNNNFILYEASLITLKMIHNFILDIIRYLTPTYDLKDDEQWNQFHDDVNYIF